ncbi:MAG: hypothetical protein AB8G18_18490 [Gammaproteobacteria bacterium]
MALIACSRCRKQISSEATACRHCGAKTGDSADPRKPKHNFFVHYMLSMLTAVTGAGIYVAALNGADFSPLTVAAAPVLGIGGTLWYVIARIWKYVV